MKKILLVFVLIFIVACSDSEAKDVIIHEDMKKDIDQIVSILDKAKEEKRELTDEEYELYKTFDDKYIMGKFTTSNDEEYEMNNLEKEIVRVISRMWIFIDESETLASEDSVYDKAKKC